MLIFVGSYEILKYIRKLFVVIIVVFEIKICIFLNYLFDVKRMIVLRYVNFVVFIWRLWYFLICFWKIFILFIKVIILFGDMWFEWILVVVNRGVI